MSLSRSARLLCSSCTLPRCTIASCSQYHAARGYSAPGSRGARQGQGARPDLLRQRRQTRPSRRACVGRAARTVRRAHCACQRENARDDDHHGSLPTCTRLVCVHDTLRRVSGGLEPRCPPGHTGHGCAGTRRRLTALLARLQRPRRSSQGRVVLGLRCSDRRTERSCCGKKRERGDTLTDPKDPFWITMMDDVTFTRVNVANSWPFCTFLYRIVPCCGRSRFHPKKTHAQFSAWVREQDRFLKPPTVCAGQALKPGVQSLTA